MSIHSYSTEQFLSTDIDTAWNFFSSAKNLSAITPPGMDFRILSELAEKDIYEGMLIDYTVKPLFGIPVRWKTQIKKIKKPQMFSDIQLKGPYKSWEHTHIFIEKENGILMHDEVKYEMPLGIIGEIANALIVRKKIEKIFAYRKQELQKIFNNNGNSHS